MRTKTRLAQPLAVLGLALALAALVMLAAGPVGWRTGWWNYRIGLRILLPYAGYVGLAAAAVSASAAIVALRGSARRAFGPAVFGLLLGITAAYFPWHWNNQRGLHPRLNDVTTDTDNPPSLAFAMAMRRAEHGNPVAYGGAKLAAVQRKSYPDIAPAMLALPPALAFGRALAVAKAEGWTILKADRIRGVIDADDRSRWFGFIDDIAIRVSPQGGGSRIDIRSAARQGRGDFGVNAARVRDFVMAVRGK